MKLPSTSLLRKTEFLVGGAALALALLAYRPLLFPPTNQPLPWGSDTLGHVLKAAYLKTEIQRGNGYPLLFPSWYLGLDMLRYHPPLPYYLMVVLSLLTGGDMIRAAHWLVVLSAWVGSWGGWPYRRWIGNIYAGALMVGLLLLPDNVRVALAEGNLPRSVAAAMLPWVIYLVLRSLEPDARPHHRALLSLLFAALVLSHAMMAAIYALGSGGIILISLFRERALPRRAFAALASIVLGLALAAWWLLPSLSGGLAALSAKALAEAQPSFPLSHYLNPFVWRTNPESIYIGTALLIGSLLLPLARRTLSPLIFLIPSWVILLITTPSIRPLFNALPLHHMLWPLRFLGLGSFLLWLSIVWPQPRQERRFLYWQGLLIALILLEQTNALRLIHTRTHHPVWNIARTLRKLNSWREATLDESRLGSEASYVFTAVSEREQVFGWAFQGARNARYLASLNEAAHMGTLVYLVDRLQRMGTDDIVISTDYPQAQQIISLLLSTGYQAVTRQGNMALFHQDGNPRAFIANWQVIGIGTSALNAAFLFPQMTVAESPYLDDFTPEALTAYRVVYLDGFRWHRRKEAEALIEAIARQGTQVVIETSHIPLSPVTHAPNFLDVWGEQVILDDTPILARWHGRRVPLQPFAQPGSFWYAHVPQGNIQPAFTFGYLGETATLAGYRPLGQGGIWFLGGNLVYHALTTGDQWVTNVLESILTIPAHQRQPLEAVELADYQANAKGYTFRVQTNRSLDLLVPITAQDGMEIQVDGNRVSYTVWEGMPVFRLSAGTHDVRLVMRRENPLYWIGWTLSVLALVALSRWERIWRGV